VQSPSVHETGRRVEPIALSTYAHGWRAESTRALPALCSIHERRIASNALASTNQIESTRALRVSSYTHENPTLTEWWKQQRPPQNDKRTWCRTKDANDRFERRLCAQDRLANICCETLPIYPPGSISRACL